MAGTRITRLGPYQIQSLIGTGGMGEVYRARDSRLQRPVALKILRPDRLGADNQRTLLQEARAASTLNHPNIVTVYEVGVHDGITFIAMELVDGETRAAVLERNALDVSQVVTYGAQIADAVARAHEAGIVHRDLKPANLMIGRDQRVKVLDFGIAKMMDDARRASMESTATGLPPTGENAIVGTLAYMSPEQATGKPIDGRSDIFAFGSVLYCMLGGRPPFERDSGIDTLSAIVHDTPRPIAQLVPDLRDELERIVNRCLRKEPARRFQSMADLHVELRELVEEADGSRSSRSSASTLASVAVLATVIVAALALGVVWIPRWLEARNRPALGGLTVSRLTFDAGLQTQPVWSPDGQFLAYTADRDGNFDIYVHQVNGGNPVRVTDSPATDWQPDWSPDGSRIVYRSERSRGGLFVVPALGGQERRISTFGYRPRWSPDGKRVMFVSSALPISEVPQVFVVEADGSEEPRTVLGPAFRQFRAAWSVQWHPTGRVMTFLGRKGDRGWDLWVASPDSDTPAKFNVPVVVKEQIVNVASAVWAPDGQSIYLEGTSPSGVTNVYVVKGSIDRLNDFGTPQMLTSGLEDGEIAVSRDGRRLAYTRRQERNRVWKLPVASTSARTHESGTPVTDEGLHALHSDLTADGKKLAFIAFRDGQARQELWEASLETGRARQLLIDDFRRVALRWSRDGRQLAYRRSSYDATRTHGQHAMVLFDTERGDETPLTSRGQDEFDIPYDWSADGRRILGGSNRQSGQTQIVTYPVDGAPQAEGKSQVIARCDDCDLWQARYSPGDRLIAFTRVPRSGLGESVIHIAPAAGGSWVEITEHGRWADKPRWSPDGANLYFISNRSTGAFNVWSQRIDPSAGSAIGEPVAVTQFAGPRVMINPLLASVELSVAPGAIVLPLLEVSGNIWLLTRMTN